MALVRRYPAQLQMSVCAVAMTLVDGHDPRFTTSRRLLYALRSFGLIPPADIENRWTRQWVLA